MSDSNNPYQPPQSPLRDSTHPRRDSGSLEPASRQQRLLAAILDGLITMIAVLPVMFHLKLFDYPTAIETQVTAFLLGFLSVLLLHGYLLHARGQSVGKAIVGIQIVGIDGKRVSLGRIIFMRYFPVQLVSQIPTLGSLLTLVDVIWIFRQDNRCLHDHIAQTMVIKYTPDIL